MPGDIEEGIVTTEMDSNTMVRTNMTMNMYMNMSMRKSMRTVGRHSRQSRQSIRLNSTTAATYIRPRPRFRDLIKAPVFKSVFLSLIFGTVMVDYIKTKRELELLNRSHQMRFTVLEGIIDKLKNGDHIDVARELKIANRLTQNKYDKLADIELDDQLDSFLKMADIAEPAELDVVESAKVSDSIPVIKDDSESLPQAKRVDSSKFL